jgi:uncharacterized membrane protein YdjX (TVP38/TMEM64 family)
LLLALWSGRHIGHLLIPIVEEVHALGPLGPLLFVAVYSLAIVALIPGTPMTVIGGALFGLVRGTAYGFAGGVFGSAAAFLLGRHIARRVVERRLLTMPRLAAIERAVSARGLRIVLLLRLSPVTPFNVLNYALGLTKITLRDFLMASVGTIPGAIVYAYAGKVAGEALALSGQAQTPRNASYYVILVAGLVATVAATAVLARAAQRGLRDV